MWAQILAVEESLHFRDNYGESGGDYKTKRSKITINATISLNECLNGLIYHKQCHLTTNNLWANIIVYHKHQDAEKPGDIMSTLLGQSLPYLYLQL